MLDNKEYFNKLASKWDEISKPEVSNLIRIMSLTKLNEKSSILDVGTGTGVLIPFLLEEDPSKVIAIDLSENMIELARNKHFDSRVEFIVGDILNSHLENFDCIMLHNVYPHIENKEELFKKAKSMLNRNGMLIIAHSISRDRVNRVHDNNIGDSVERLPVADKTANLMSHYFEITDVIDEEIYFVKGVMKD